MSINAQILKLVLPTMQNWVFRNLGGRKSMKLFS